MKIAWKKEGFHPLEPSQMDSLLVLQVQ